MPKYAYTGNPRETAEALRPIVEAKGKSFCRYPCEAELIADAKVFPKSMEVEDDLIFALYTENESMAYTKKQIEKTLDIILASNNEKWKMSLESIVDWRETMCRRIRNLCRCISQKIGKKESGTPQWFKDLRIYKVSREDKGGKVAEEPKDDAMKEEPKDDAMEEEQDKNLSGDDAPIAKLLPPPATQKFFTIKFDHELMLATRKENKKDMNSETSKPFEDRGKPGHEIVEAEFLDGTKHKVPGMTWESFRALIRSKKAKGLGALLSLEHKTTKHAITISQRVDRKLLLSLYEQGRQKLQVQMDLFGVVEEHSMQLKLESETLKKALAFMTPIAIRFANDELSGDALTAERDRLLKSEGILVKAKKCAKKRPAADVRGELNAESGRPFAKAKAKTKAKPTPKATQATEVQTRENEQSRIASRPEDSWSAYDEMDEMPMGFVEQEFNK
jgi:hypothetical protein